MTAADNERSWLLTELGLDINQDKFTRDDLWFMYLKSALAGVLPGQSQGTADSLGIGTVSTLTPGSSATATITGTSPTKFLNLGLPAGFDGASGATGATGPAGSNGTTPVITGTSASSITIGTGSKTFSTQAGLALVVGQYIRVANGSNYMGGNITAYSGTSITVNIVDTGGTGTFASWVLSISGPAGPQGTTGTTGSTGPANSLAIGTVTGGVSASATVTGTAPSQTLNLVLPTGPQGTAGSTGATGPANSLSIGTVTAGPAAATITGTAPSQVLNLVLQTGATGSTGATGAAGAAGAVWYTGNNPTSTAIMAVVKSGDFFIYDGTSGVNAGNVYTYNGTAWVFTVNLNGPTGPSGSNGTNGTSVVIVGTSTTSFTIGTGSKAFTTQAGMAFVVGQYVRVYQTTTPANWMGGFITAYSGTTLTVNVTDTGGSGTVAAWTIALGGVQGPQGTSGTTPVVSGTSTSSITPGTGAKTFVTQAGMALVVGQYVRVQNTTSNWFAGAITAYSGTSMTVTATTASGSTTAASWTISISGDLALVYPAVSVYATSTWSTAAADGGPYTVNVGWATVPAESTSSSGITFNGSDTWTLAGPGVYGIMLRGVVGGTLPTARTFFQILSGTSNVEARYSLTSNGEDNFFVSIPAVYYSASTTIKFQIYKNNGNTAMSTSLKAIFSRLS